MGKEEPEVERKEKQICGCRLSTLFKLINMIIGGLMIFYSVVTFFTIKIADGELFLVYSFKVYEM